MNASRRAALTMMAAGGWLCAPARAEQRFPPPQFETGHALPSAAWPAAESPLWDAVDIALLAAALLLASWLILRRRHRTSLLTLSALSLLYFGFYREGCVCAIGSIQNVALALGESGYAIPAATAAFFALPLLAALCFGRSFCAAVCPQGAIQELVILRPLNVPLWLDRPLGLLRYLYLALAVVLAWTGSAFIICEYDPFVGFFRMSASPAMVFFGAALLLAGIFIARPYCRYLCPYGVLLGWMAFVSKWHAKIDPQGCVSCHLCAKSCPVNAIEVGIDTTGAREDDAMRRRRIARLIVLLPVLMALGGATGYGAAAQLARMHATVQLAERIAEEESGAIGGTTDAVRAFRSTGRSTASLFEQAQAVRERMARIGPVAGGFMGMVLGLALLRGALRRERKTYDIDRARCVSCARCFDYCPHEPQRLVALTTPMSTDAPALRQRLRPTAIGVGVAAGIFSAAVAVSLLLSHRDLSAGNPLVDASMASLRSQLRKAPGDGAVIEQVRRRDQELRTRLLEERSFAAIGGWLVLGGVVITIAALTYARRRREPAASELTAMTQGDRELSQFRERWGTAFVGLAVISAAMVAAIRPVIPLHVAKSAPATPQLLQMDPVWPTFRGPGGAGICRDSDRFTYPRQWSGPEGQNIRWKTAVALPGRNSPVICGDRVFCTGADEKQREVYCYDASTGELRWSRRVDAGPANREPVDVEHDTGHAASTAATDGRRVYAIFANGDLAALDLDGRPVWAHPLGEPLSAYGYASSLTIHDQTVIVQWDQGRAEESLSRLIAFDGATGTKRWETTRPVGGSWASPVIVSTGPSSSQLITAALPWVIAYDPGNGEELWRCELITSDAAPSPVGGGERVFIVNPNDRVFALPTNTRGAMKEDRAAWFYDGCVPDIPSPLFDGQFLYVPSTYGELHCLRASDGKVVWTHEFDGATFHASPILIGDVLYLTSTAGMTYLVQTGETFELLGAADLDERVEASLAAAGGNIFIRGETHLYCIGRTEP